MKRAVLALAVSGAVVITSGNLLAMQRGNGGGPKPKPAGGSTHVVKTHSPAPKGQGGSAAKSPKAPKAMTTRPQGPKATGHGNSGAKSQPSKTAKAPKTKATDTAVAPTVGTLSPVQQKLQKNTNLANKLDARLPAGMDPVTAAAGFRNLGQFVAAVNVSNNLGIPFTQLKTSIVTDGMSLGQAIQTHRPSANSGTEARRAESDATNFIDRYDQTSVTSKKKPKSSGGN